MEPFITCDQAFCFFFSCEEAPNSASRRREKCNFCPLRPKGKERRTAWPSWLKILLGFHSEHPEWDQNLQFPELLPLGLSETTNILIFFTCEPPQKLARNMFFFLHSTDIIIRTKACSLSRHLTMVEPPMERHDWLKCSKSDIRHKALWKRAQNCWATTSNVVGCYMLRPFTRPVACCCGLLGVYALSSFSLGTTEISRRN